MSGSFGTAFTPRVYGVKVSASGMRAGGLRNAFGTLSVVGSVAQGGGRWQSRIVAEYYTIPDLVELFDRTPGKIRRLIEDHHLAAVRIDGVLQVPADFVQNEEPVHGLRGTLLVLLDAGFSEDEAVEWLLGDNGELGERPVDALRDGRKSAVRRATQSLAF